MRIVKLTDKNLESAVHEAKLSLEQGGLVVFPSDTVYGLAADATNDKAVAKLLSFKDRSMGKAVSVAVPTLTDFEKYAEVNESNKAILSALLPGPFTVVLNSKHTLVKSLEAEDGTLGLRLPNDMFVNALSGAVNFPFTATSANLAGRGPHYGVNALLSTLSEKKKNLIDLVVDGGQLPHHSPSTVVNLSSGSIQILRTGELNPVLIKETETYSEQETKLFAQSLLLDYQKIVQTHPLVFILKGELGTGKTVFTKGIGEALHTVPVVSPTFVLYYEYDAVHPDIRKLHHFDLYRAQHSEDIKALGIDILLKPQNLLVFEWGEKINPMYEVLKKHGAIVVFINISEINERTRLIQVFEIRS